MLRVVEANRLVLLLDAQPHGQVEHLGDDESDHRGVDEHGPRGNGVDDELVGVSEEEPVRSALVEDLLRKQPRGQRAHGPADAVDAECVQGIIIGELLFHHGHRHVAHARHDETDAHGGDGGDKPRGGRYGNEPSHGAGRGPEDRRPFRDKPVDHHPSDCRGRRCRVRVDESRHGELVRLERASRVEAEPAEPQERRADQRVRHVVGRRRDAREARPPANDQRHHERGNPRRHVHHGPSRKIQGAEVVEPSVLAPHPVGNGIIDERGPHESEHHEGRKLDSLRIRPRDERRCDDGEHHLEEHVELVGDGGRVVGVRGQADSVEPQPGQVPEQVPDVGAERDLDYFRLFTLHLCFHFLLPPKRVYFLFFCS